MHNVRKILLLISLFLITEYVGQNKKLLYNFAELPQTLLLNPGAETNLNYHIGIPLLSGISTEIESTGFSIADLFADDNRSINDKFSNVLDKLRTNDYVKLNIQLEVLNAGFRLNNDYYFSFGFYEEFDAIVYYPKDIITLVTEGNSSFLNKSFELSQTLFKIDLLGVLHFGFTNKVSENVTFGARFKIYSSALNVESFDNSGTFTTVNGSNNTFTHYLDNIYLEARTSGLYKEEKFTGTSKKYLKNTFFGGNLGIGFDVGFTYHLSDQIELTGSILDVGFINHSKNTQNSFTEGSYVSEWVAFEYDPNSPSEFGILLEASLKDKLHFDQNEDSYISWRPSKVNASFTYRFGTKRSMYCYDNTYKEFYRNGVGVHLYSVFRPLSPQFAVTGFYQKSLSQKFHTKLTYTVDNYSFSTIGVGLSTQIGKLNIYGVIDNVLKFSNITKANNISAQLGLNIIF